MTDTATAISSMATARLLADLAATYRRETGREVAPRPMGGVEAARLVRAGEPADVVLLASAPMAALEREGHVVTGSRRDVVRSGIAVAVRAGTARPEIGDEAGVRRAAEAARRIGVSTGPSGDHLRSLLGRWGVEAGHLVQAPPGTPVGSLLAAGEVDLGFQQLSELLDAEGIDVVGPLPPAIQSVTLFAAGIARSSTRPEEAEHFIAFLASAGTADAKRRFGLEPC